MNFRSILSSSKLEIITSKRVMAFVYLALGSAILVWWIGALQQFFDAHLTYGQFDTTVTAFVLITLLLFCPLALTGALMLHAFILRERLLHWLKTRTVIADYTSGLSPAEAGTLVDFEYSLEETWATLLSLHFRNSITMRTTTHGIILSQGPEKPFNNYERVLIDRLFGYSTKEIVIHDAQDKRISDAGYWAHGLLVSDLEYLGALQVRVNRNPLLRKAIVTMYYIAGFFGVLMVIGMLFGGESFWGINYPRYDTHPIQIITLLGITVVYLLIVFSAFLPKLTDNYKSTPEILNLQAAGYYEYLKNVYSHRLSSKNLHTQEVRTVSILVPYMIAYRIIRPDMRYLQQVLTHTQAG